MVFEEEETQARGLNNVEFCLPYIKLLMNNLQYL